MLPALHPTRSGCPIATSLDIIGDRWTLVIVRDLVNGKTRFGELASSPEKIPTNILAARLRAMEAAGLIERRAYQTRPPRHAYALTSRGEALLPLLQAMCRWAAAEIPETWRAPEAFMRRRVARGAATRSATATARRRAPPPDRVAPRPRGAPGRRAAGG